MIIKVEYKGKIIDEKDVLVTWSDCFGYPQVDSLADFASRYGAQEAGIAEAGEDF